jgi:hypothetical protein
VNATIFSQLTTSLQQKLALIESPFNYLDGSSCFLRPVQRAARYMHLRDILGQK